MLRIRHGAVQIILSIVVGLLIVNPMRVSASETIPYSTYIYDYYGDVKYTPAPFIPDGKIDGVEWECGTLNRPLDLSIDENGKIYIADTGNNRIVVIDKNFEFLGILESYTVDGEHYEFSSPTGLSISRDGVLYVADTGNNQVVALDDQSNVIRVIEKPASEVLEEGFVFEPLKVAVDYADRVYVIARNMFQGIMTFDSDGNFRGFSGKIEVKISTYDKIWRKFTTKEQRSKQQLFIPTEFTGMEVDQDGFIYATNVDPQGTQAIRRLNPKGEDVIRTGPNQQLGGDLNFRWSGDYSGASRIEDIVIRENGIYSVIDFQRGRVFTYDYEGNLLYIFGGLGSQTGTFTSPVAIEKLDDRLLVLDSSKNAIMLFEKTMYGALIDDAVSYRYQGMEQEAALSWEKVLEQNSNFELAYLGLGKSYLNMGENKKAMEYFKLSRNQKYYSMAFKRHRNDVLRNNLQNFLTISVVAVGGVIIYKKVRRSRRDKNDE